MAHSYMENALRFLADLVNNLHDIILAVSRMLRLNMTDKELHFWLIGSIGILLFLISDYIFRRVARWSISILSFIYTFTVLIVVVLGLEIEQKITGRGNMEFTDVIAGVWGFLVMFGVYSAARVLVWLTLKYLGRQ